MAKTSHVILEFDRDYRTMTDIAFKDFPTDRAANEYAKEQSWSGYDYHAMTWENYFRRRGNVY